MSELALHIAVIDLLRKLGRHDVLYWHCANGEHRDRRTAAKLKAMGVKPGVSDLTVSLPDGRFGFLELKFGDNKLTTEQRDFLEAMSVRGHLTGLAYSVDAALKLLASWGAIRIASQPQLEKPANGVCVMCKQKQANG